MRTAIPLIIGLLEHEYGTIQLKAFWLLYELAHHSERNSYRIAVNITWINSRFLRGNGTCYPVDYQLAKLFGHYGSINSC